MEPVTDAFKELTSQPRSEQELRTFAETLPPDAFESLKDFLVHPAGVDLALRTSAAFQIFCQVNPPFRTALAEFALRLRAGIVDRVTRETLTCLVKACEAHPEMPHGPTFRAFVYHRGYWQAAAVGGRPDVGDSVREWLIRHARILPTLPTEEFVPLAAFATATKHLPSDRALVVWPRAAREAFTARDAALMNELLGHLMSDEVISNLDVDEAAVILQIALLEAYGEASVLPRFESVKALLTDALLRHLNQVLRLWTRAFATWHWIAEKRPDFTPERAHDAERLVRESIDRLAGGPAAEGPRLLDVGAADRYTRLIGLMGGWDWPPNPLFNRGTIPSPAWERDWERAFLSTLPALPAEPPLGAEESRLNLLEAVPIHALIGLSQRVLRLERQGPNGSGTALRDESEVYLVDTVLQSAAETVSVAREQRLLPGLPLGESVEPSMLANDPSAYLLAAMSNPRTALNAPLHPDFRRALRIVLAAFYAWKADVLYRELGARPLDRALSPESTAPVLAVYDSALELLEGQEERLDGLGMAGRMLDLLREETLNECHLRVSMLQAGQDFGGSALRAVTLEPNALVRAVDSILQTLSGLSSLADLDEQRQSLETDVDIALATLERDRDLQAASESFLEADQFTQRAIEHEAKQQAVRVAIAELRRQEAKWHVAAQRYAVQAAQGNADAQQKFKEAKELEEERLRQQVAKLRDALEDLLPDLIRLRDEDIPQAQAAFDQFKQDARTRFNRKQAQRSLFNIVKRIGSLVSMYFTGVDLVSIAETAYSVYRAADSGDWLSAIGTAAEGADRLSGGKLSGYLRDAGDTAKSYAGSLIPDRLQDAARIVGQELGISPGDAMEKAVLAIGRQTFRLGVSFLAETTHTTALAQRLGVPSSSAALQELREDARTCLFEAAYNAIEKQGPQVVAKAEQILGSAAGGLRDKIRNLVPQGPDFSLQFDAKLVDLIRRIQKDLPEADIAILKAEMLRARDETIAKAKAWAGVEADRLQGALDDLIEDALGGLRVLPPAPLPDHIAETLRDFHARVEKGRNQIAFLTAPEKANELANQISEANNQDAFDRTLQKVTDDLQGRLDGAREQVAEATDDLNALHEQLADLQWDQAIAGLNAKAQAYLAQAAGFTVDQQQALASATAESLLAGEQAVKIEEIGVDIVRERLNAQRSIVEGRRSQVEAAKSTVTIAELNLTRTLQRRDRFALNYSAQGQKERAAIARAKSFYRERAKNLLIQAYLLVSLYEFDLSALPALKDFRPVFKPMKEDRIQASLNALKQAREDWKYQRIEDLQVLFSVEPSHLRVAATLNPNLESLVRYITSLPVTPQPALELSGADLPILARGMTFRLLPRDLPPNLVREFDLDAPPLETTLDPRSGLGESALNFVPRRVRGWNDRRVYRVRVLGVILEILSGVRPGDAPQFFIAQESGFIVVPSDSGSKAITVPLDRTIANGGAGVAMSSGALVLRGVNVWPLFGTYTLSTPDDRDIDPMTFRARLHFVAVGSPPEDNHA